MKPLLFDQKEKLYKLFIDNVKDYAIFILDTDGVISTWNSGAERIKGYKENEIVGKHFSIFYLPEFIEIEYPQYELRQSIKDGRFEDEGWRLRKDGTTFWANVIIVPLFENGEHKGFAKITRDLTERKKSEENMLKANEALQESNFRLRKANRDLDSIIYSASHEIKSPIANIEAAINLLSDENSSENNKENYELYKIIISSLDQLKTTINHISELTGLSKEINEDNRIISISEIVSDVALQLNREIINCDAEIEVDLKVDKIFFSRFGFSKVVKNLLSNAIKFRSPERKLQIKIETEDVGEDYMVMRVCDNGLGLSNNQLSNLFKLFKRFHVHENGVGVGLYLVKNLVESHGGFIEVSSEEDKGSIFKVIMRKG